MHQTIFHLAFWICGYAFAFGKGNPFIGSQDFYVLSDTSDARLPHFFLQALLSSIPVRLKNIICTVFFFIGGKAYQTSIGPTLPASALVIMKYPKFRSLNLKSGNDYCLCRFQSSLLYFFDLNQFLQLSKTVPIICHVIKV